MSDERQLRVEIRAGREIGFSDTNAVGESLEELAKRLVETGDNFNRNVREGLDFVEALFDAISEQDAAYLAALLREQHPSLGKRLYEAADTFRGVAEFSRRLDRSAEKLGARRETG